MNQMWSIYQTIKKSKITVFYLLSFLVIQCSFSEANANPLITNLIEPTKYFTGRVEYLKSINTYFSEGKKVITLAGIAGIGKSQIARQYAKNTRSKYRIIWIFNCNRDLESQFQELAEQINIKLCKHGRCKVNNDLSEAIKAVSTYLSGYDDWLLIFDNVSDSSNLDIMKTFINRIRHNNQHILITTRQKGILPNAIGVKPFKREESIKLLSQILKNYSSGNLSIIAALLRDYPLGIHKSAFFLLQNPYITLTDYKIMINEKFNILDQLPEIDSYIAEQSILKLVKSYFIKLKPDSKRLLIYCTLLDHNNLYKNLLYDVYKKSGTVNEYNDFLNNLLELNNYSLIEYKERKMEMTSEIISQVDLELHDLLQKTIQESIDKPIIEEHLRVLIKKINKILSDDSLEDILAKYPSLLGNLEAILGNTNKYSVDEVDVLQLKKNLLVMYSYELNYLKVKELLNWFDEKLDKDLINKIPDTASVKSIIADYLIVRGWYYDNINDEYEIAIENYNKALSIMAQYESEYYELICEIYIILAQTEINAGDLVNAEKHIIFAEELINKHEKMTLPKKSFYYFVRSLIEMNKSNNEKALAIIIKGEEIKKALNYEFQASAATFLLKAEILTKLGRVKEAYPILRELHEKAIIHFDDNHELQARILTELAIAELELEQLKLSEEHINKATEILFTHTTTLIEADNNLARSDDLFYIYVVKGNLEYKKNNFEKAFENYKNAFSISQSRYKKNEVDHISELYYKMAITAHKLKDFLLFRQFLEKQEKDFGIDHYRTKELYKYIALNN